MFFLNQGTKVTLFCFSVYKLVARKLACLCKISFRVCATLVRDFCLKKRIEAHTIALMSYNSLTNHPMRPKQPIYYNRIIVYLCLITLNIATPVFTRLLFIVYCASVRRRTDLLQGGKLR